MTRRRRCRICHELFTSDPRVGLRQKACGSPECQTERHRLDCKAWRERERPAEGEERLRGRLGGPGGPIQLRYAALRVMDPGRVSRLAASIARDGQQSPVLVVAEGVLVDGYYRVWA